ncbi:MAG TPA: hypothetical protein VHM90_19315 [Phycisphaerae bacterium]|nr:hypothetical protein [Phycisphaerae bacterium]
MSKSALTCKAAAAALENREPLMNQPDFLSYTKSHSGRRIPPQSVINRVWHACWILAAVMFLLALAIEFENYHFDSFFPRRDERPGSHWLKPFEPDVVDDESSWRDWQGMLTGKEDFYTKSLSPADRANMALRIAENGRWNRFVALVKWGSPPLVAISVAVFVLSILLLRWLDSHAAIWRWRLTHVFLVTTVLITLDILVRGYLRLFGDRIW